MEVIKRSQKNSTKKSNRFHDFVQKNSCQEMPCPVRACLKNHFRNLQAPLCGIFYPHSVAVARYAALIRINSPTNWNSQLTKSLFQTRSNSHIRVSMSDDRIEILLFILLRTAYWTAFNLLDVEFIVIGRSLTRIPVRYKLIDS